jgi:hypothetical protein
VDRQTGTEPQHPAASTLDLECDRSAPRRARDHVYDLLHGAGPVPDLSEDDLFDVLLCTSELVNAALLGGCTSMTLAVYLSADGIRVTLSDDTPNAVAALESTRAQEHCLRVVANLADRWHSEVRPTVRITTAEIDVRRSGRARGPDRG